MADIRAATAFMILMTIMTSAWGAAPGDLDRDMIVSAEELLEDYLNVSFDLEHHGVFVYPPVEGR
ncbi:MULTISPECIES: hypothetical protein [Methanothrix]|uniref:hypothetical protein n=1 Tax=Methanothrix TaxID=2222 RepID=UPI000AE0686D|nr:MULTISPECIES: hypothetical protein [Methanothrix]NPU87391.1 hypothetical protein [Methanothrix sp.]